MSNYIIVAAHLSGRRLLLHDGTMAAIFSMFDEFGEVTEDPAAAIAVTAVHPDGQWLAVDVTELKKHKPH